MSNPWVYIRIGEHVGLLEPSVYQEIIKPEIERAKKLTDSNKMTAILGMIFLNSSQTPTGSLE